MDGKLYVLSLLPVFTILLFQFNPSFSLSPDAGIFPTFQVCNSFSIPELLAGMLECCTKLLSGGIS